MCCLLRTSLRAGSETALARRRYEAVDPQNRLVARTLERDWEAALTAEQGRDDHQRALTRQPERLTAQDKAAIRHLARASVVVAGSFNP